MSRHVVLGILGVLASVAIVAVGIHLFQRPSKGILIPSAVELSDSDFLAYQISGDNPDTVSLLSASTVWITKGDFAVSVRGTNSDLEQIVVANEGGVLSVRNRDASVLRHSPELLISIPELRIVNIEGVSTVSISGFDAEELSLQIDGAGHVTLSDSDFRQLAIRAEGASYVDASEAVSGSATVEIEGAATVELRMGGGTLGGRIEGLGRILYSGSVESESIEIEGLGYVDKID